MTARVGYDRQVVRSVTVVRETVVLRIGPYPGEQAALDHLPTIWGPCGYTAVSFHGLVTARSALTGTVWTLSERDGAWWWVAPPHVEIRPVTS